MTTTWDPLHGGDPFPADPDRVRTYGQAVARTGELIGEQVALLRTLQQEDSWYTDAADALREKAEELADKIDKTKGRYVDTGAALTTFADTLDGLEEQAVVKRDRARELQATICANPEVEPPTGPGPDGSPPPDLTPEQEAQNRARADAIADLAQVQREFDALVSSGEEAARTCAGAIEDATDDDVKDDWWDRNAGWIKVATQILGAIATIAAIVLLTIATAGTIWLVIAIGATLLSLILNVGLALYADGGWTAVVIDAVSLLTLGSGAVLARIAGKAFPAMRTAVATLRGSRAFSATMGRMFGIPRAFYGALNSSRISFISRIGMNGLTRLTDDAIRSSDEAFNAVMATRPTTVLQRIVHGGEQGAQHYRVTRELLDMVRTMPNVAPDLVQGLNSLRNVTLAATGVTTLGTVNDIADIVNEEHDGLQDLKEFKVLVDLITRVAPG